MFSVMKDDSINTTIILSIPYIKAIINNRPFIMYEETTKKPYISTEKIK